MQSLENIGKRAKESSRFLATALSDLKDHSLIAISAELEIGANIEKILCANEIDLANASGNGIRDAMLDRLRLTRERIIDIAEAVRYVASLDDPVGEVLGGGTRPNGLSIIKRSVPFGVIGVIYESRPNVTVDCAALCLKSGNACILRGGKEAIFSNKVLVEIMRSALKSCGIPEDCIQLIEDTSRESADKLMRLNEYLDLLIPRGGAGLINNVVQNATVPVIETGTGNCHIYVDEYADLSMSAKVLDNAKTSRPSVCNAVETLLVHEAVASEFLPMAAEAIKHANVEIRACEKARPLLGCDSIPATESDWETEYDDYILAVKVVSGIDEAVSHIEKYSTRHSETIMTNNYFHAKKFTEEVDSAAVYVNASTRFTDGGVFGLGAEIGISTQKLHARGPMGLSHLTSYKYIISGDGQVR